MVHSVNDSRYDTIALGVLVVNALTSAGFATAGLVTASSDAFALYAAARSVPIAIVVIGAVATRSRLVAFAVLLSIIQACDALVGVAQHDAGKTIGPIVLAIATAFAARRFHRRSGILTTAPRAA